MSTTTASETTWQNDPLWYKDAIIYQTHVKAFGDSNNDGIGDFRGLTERLDYIQSLGVNTIWVLPFYPSPLRDDGYDIADYLNVHPQYGTLADFKRFLREAHKRGLKVITELVINHTSDQHPWFQAARQAPKGSRKRNFYVWNDDDKKFPETRIIFTDTEASNWAWDPVAQQYYWHRFFSHQPDLNHNNPDVVKAVIKLLHFWMDLGVDGMRLDAIPYLCVQEGTNNENLPETHAVIKQMRAALDARYQGRMFLAEANQWPEDVRDYFGDGDECQMAYHFPLMPRMYMAIALEDRHPIIEIMAQTPEIPDNCQWAIFLRNHDELTLEMVTDRERDYMYSIYAADPRMRVNVGIRRRLAPLLNNNIELIKLMNSLLLSMPGSPIIYYGDEIGMGDNIYLGDRNGVRTPMQWSPDRNAGFSKADPQKLYLPPIMDPIYGYEAVNVEAQSRSPSSLLNWMRRLIGVRSQFKAFGRGTLGFLYPGNRKVLAYLREYADETILCVANLSRTAQPVELDLSRFKGRVPMELRDRIPFPPIGELPYLLTLQGHDFYWFRLSDEAAAPVWHQDHLVPEQMAVLVLFSGWKSFFPELHEGSRRNLAEKLITALQDDVLPKFLPYQRWFAAKGETITGIHFSDLQIIAKGRQDWIWARIEVQVPSGVQSYSLPLALAWESRDEDTIHSLWAHSMAKVRQQAKVGVLYDAFADPLFCRFLIRQMGERETLALGDGQLKFTATNAFDEVDIKHLDELSIGKTRSEGSNTAVTLGGQLFLKGYRRLQTGSSPELEIGRFLTEHSSFQHIVPLYGAVEYTSADGDTITLALLQAYTANQGDAWVYTLDLLRRGLEQCVAMPVEEALDHAEEYYGVFWLMMKTLGQRTGELHRALAGSSDDPAFAPEPIEAADLRAWSEQVRNEALLTLDRLEQHRDELSGELEARVGQLLALRGLLTQHLDNFLPSDINAVKTRYHGDYHLGQVLLAENDFVIIDFEGEPARALAERRQKHSALKDVAGMLRSFNYAAYAALYDVADNRNEELGHLESLVQDWQRRTEKVFLEGYRAGIEDCPVWPQQDDHGRRIIDLFMLEKAFYELRYELDHRPTWLAIPLGGLFEFMITHGITSR